MTDVNARSAVPEFVSRAQPSKSPSSAGGINDNASQQGKDQFSRVLDKESRDQSTKRSDNADNDRRAERSRSAQSQTRSNAAEKRADKNSEPSSDKTTQKAESESVESEAQTTVKESETVAVKKEATDDTDSTEAAAVAEQTDVLSEAEARANALKQLAALLDLPVEDLKQVSEEADNALLDAILRRSEHLAAKVDGEGPGEGSMKPEQLAELQQKWADKLQQHLGKLEAGESETVVETKLPVQIDQLQQRLQQLMKAENKSDETPLDAKGLVRAMAAQLIPNQGEAQSGDKENLSEEVMDQALQDAMDLLEAVPEDRFEQIIKNVQAEAMSEKQGMKLAHLEKQIASDMLESLGVRSTGESVERMGPNSIAAVLRPQAPQTAASLMLQPHLQDSEWGAVFNQRIAMMVRNDLGSAELRLNPPELGAVQVKLQVVQDQATVTFSSAHGNVREAIEAALPRLREMLAEAGVNLSSVDVNSNFKQHHEQAEQQMAGEHSQNGNGSKDGNADDDTLLTGNSRVRISEGLVDAYA